ncbi:MAG: nitrous oxide reductase family maturation protein NosD [Cyclobacteriaceae bacterium]|nr:nitrous oxide reductase family maturation protein NosD [Cyclobacteriaceae bacterium]
MKRSVFFIGLVLISLAARATTIPVGARETIKHIKEAIQRAEAGDTLLIRSGIYREGNIILEKQLVILGENFPVLDGENQYEIFTIHAQGVVIQGLTFKDTGIASISDLAAIKILESKKVRILGNRFENTFFGIYLANSSNIWIENNQLQSQAESEHQIGNGIHLWKCDHITINNNRIRGHRDGIYFEFVTNSLITNNYSEGNMRYGLHFMFSHNDEYRNNAFTNNGAGVAVMYTKGVTMVNNTFQHNWGSSSYGLLLKDIRDSFVTDNTFIENSVGIFMEGSSRNEIKSNSFYQNGYALKLQASCDDNVITRNNFQQNTFDLVTNGSLVLNKIDGNYWDRYEGYDLNRDQVGDVPYRPISMYGTIVERMPQAILLWRSFLVFLLDRAERAIPVLTPENLMDQVPAMQPYDFY